MAFIKNLVVPLHIESFLTSSGREMFEEGMVKLAEREPNKIRLGKQKLYEEPEEVIKRYMTEGFDIIEEMKSRPESFLWVRARAIDGDVVNENGDFFEWEEIIKDRDIGGVTMASFKSFEGCPIYTNHKNDDINEA